MRNLTVFDEYGKINQDEPINQFFIRAIDMNKRQGNGIRKDQ